MKQTTSVSFYVKAGPQTGMGHIYRCVALADKLTALGATCRFYGNRLAREIAARSGHGECLPLGYVYDGDMHAIDMHSTVWVADLEGGCPPQLAQDLRSLSSVFVILNGVGYPDGDPGRLLANLVIYQGVTDRPRRLDWDGYEGEWYEGEGYVILRDGIVRRRRETHYPVPHVLVFGGGADIGGVSRRVVGAVNGQCYNVRVVVGAASPDRAAWPDGVEVVRDPDNVFEHLDWADVAAVSYGMTAFECLASGLPTVALSITEDHKRSAQLVAERSRYGLFPVGLVNEISDEEIGDAVETTLVSLDWMSKRALRFIDCGGAARVAQKIMEIIGG